MIPPSGSYICNVGLTASIEKPFVITSRASPTRLLLFGKSPAPIAIPIHQEMLAAYQQQNTSFNKGVRKRPLDEPRYSLVNSAVAFCFLEEVRRARLEVDKLRKVPKDVLEEARQKRIRAEERENLRRCFLAAQKFTLMEFHRNVNPQRRQEHVVCLNIKDELQRAWTIREQAMERARLQALKQNDTEAYLAHLSSVKLSSLLSIMETTHRFMMKIGAALTAKASTTEPHTDDGAQRRQMDSTDALLRGDDYARFKAYVASTKDEYQLVHKRSVFVAEQPKSLKATLMPHQMVGLRFLASLHANNINGILADEMGVGKTLQTLSFLLYLKETLNCTGPHLVLAPLSIVREWKEAASEFLTNFSVVEWSDMEDPVAEARNHNVILLAVHRVRQVTTVLKRIPFYFVVVDEAHKAVSNPDTLTASAIDTVPYQHRLVLTGTPLNNDIQELWSLLHFLNPDVFSESRSFEDVFRRPFSASCGNEISLDEEEKQLLVVRMHQILRPFMLRRTKLDVDMTLKITHHTITCPLSWLQSFVLSKLREKSCIPSITGIGTSHLSYGFATAGKEKCSQSICNHPFMIPFFNDALRMAKTPPEEVSKCALMSSGKFVVLDYILQRMKIVGRKTVVFSHWLDTIDLVQEYLRDSGRQAEYVVLTGSSSDEERRECVKQFRENDQVLVMLLSMKAGGCGLNLQISNVVVMLDRDYTTTNEDQAIARTFRIGQKETVRAFSLLSEDPSEQRILEIAERKNKPREAIIDRGGYNVASEGDDSVTSTAEYQSILWSETDFQERLDNLLCPSTVANASDLQRRLNETRPEAAIKPFYQAETDVPEAIAQALAECARDKTLKLSNLGFGKRVRNETIETPPDAFYEKWLAQGLNFSEIEQQYRLEQREVQLHSAAQWVYGGPPSQTLGVKLSLTKKPPFIQVDQNHS